MGFVRKLTGAEGVKQAAEQGSRLQAQAGREAIQLQREQFEQAQENLAPFLQFAQGLLPQAEQLFGPQAGQSILDDPAFGALASEAERRIMASQAARGRLGTGETPVMLQDALLRTGMDFLGRQRGDLLSAIGLGSGVGTNIAGLGAGQAARSGDLLSQIANVQASGLQGSALARQQGRQQIMQLGTMALGALCDRRAKRDITPHGEYKGHKTYKFRYKHRDEWFIGPMADEVKAKKPEAVFNVMGYDHVIIGDL